MGHDLYAVLSKSTYVLYLKRPVWSLWSSCQQQVLEQDAIRGAIISILFVSSRRQVCSMSTFGPFTLADQLYALVFSELRVLLLALLHSSFGLCLVFNFFSLP